MSSSLNKQMPKRPWVKKPKHLRQHESILCGKTDSFSQLVGAHWHDLARRFHDSENPTSLDGRNLTIAAVVHVARYGGSAQIDPSALQIIERSATVLRDSVKSGEIIYGVNTGYGGSADTRTNDVVGLQQALLRTLQYGIVSNDHVLNQNAKISKGHRDLVSDLNDFSNPLTHHSTNHDMPHTWVKAMMTVRVNSLAGGVSGIDLDTLEVLVHLLAADVIPQVPLRGSISASGDLSPLSYVAGVMQGDAALRAYVDGSLIPANEALTIKGIRPAALGPKEGLAIVNGTAASAAVGCLAMHEILQLTVMSEILTAMSTEALLGTDESFDPFISQVRPHPGQIDAARNIHGFLSGSQLLTNNHSSAHTLRQDRYSLRTSTQWIGPVLEDLQLAFKQVTTEVNSVTDNPLIDQENRRHLHGGNFQARSITSAMEKVRQSCQVIGKMLFAQCTEMINPKFNHGLPPNLAVDEPSKSFLFKGVDIMIAALCSELGFLSAPVNHVETAEMGNQALNSLALISGRYTLEAIDVLSQLTAAHLAAVCQALDLRALQRTWLYRVRHVFDKMVSGLDSSEVSTSDSIRHTRSSIWASFCKSLDVNSTMDSYDRITIATGSVLSAIIDITAQTTSVADIKSELANFISHAHHLFTQTRDEYVRQPDATPFLGVASKRLYSFVRNRLGVPFANEQRLRDSSSCFGTTIQSPLYAAIRSGAFWPSLMECLEDVDKFHTDRDSLSAKL